MSAYAYIKRAGYRRLSRLTAAPRPSKLHNDAEVNQPPAAARASGEPPAAHRRRRWLRAERLAHSCQDCCKAGQAYPTYMCSPPVSSSTRAVMTLNDFDEGGEGGDSSECDGKFHRNSERVVALSTGWYSGGSRCGKNVRIRANGGSVLAKVVDECDTLNGCDREHGYQPPCRNNVVDASQAVWDGLGITGEEVGEYNVTWSDA